jgi:MoxR-like ATPase
MAVAMSKKVKRRQEMIEDITPQYKFMQARRVMSEAFIERDEEVDLLLTALVCRENPLLVGPPGTAKTLMTDSFMEWIEEANKFSILMTKFTVPEEIFGPISISSLERDQYRRITTGMLPEAYVAYLDEIFKSSSAILNTTLKIMNERLFQNGDGKFYKVPLQLLVASSNEHPNSNNGGEELNALYDRFLLRKNVSYITSAIGRNKLLWSGSDHKPVFPTKITIPEIEEAREFVKGFKFTHAAQEGFNRVIELLSQEGIKPGDRRQYKAIGACKAYAFLCGAGSSDALSGPEVELEHLEILAHILWDDPNEQPKKCARIISKIANPVGSQVLDIIAQAQEILAKNTGADATNKLKDLKDRLKTTARKRR